MFHRGPSTYAPRLTSGWLLAVMLAALLPGCIGGSGSGGATDAGPCGAADCGPGASTDAMLGGFDGDLPDARAVRDAAPVPSDDAEIAHDADLTDTSPPADASLPADASPPADASLPADGAPPIPDAAVGACQPGESRACGLDVGACRAGLQVCGPDAMWSPCQNGIAPTDETCNAQDDDCDGQVDEVDDAGGPCATDQLGACATGTRACVAGELVCMPATAPMAEACNGIDDDCDGSVDEVPDFAESPLLLSDRPGLFRQPALIGADAAFLLAWIEQTDGRRDAFVRRYADGGLGPMRPLSDPEATALSPALGWTGAAFLAAWSEGDDAPSSVLHARQLAADGEPAGGAVRLDGSGGQAQGLQLLWNGDAFALLWARYDAETNRFGLTFRSLAAGGRPTAQQITLVPDYVPTSHHAAWGNDVLATVYVTAADLDFFRFQRFTAAGAPIGASRAIEGVGNIFPESARVYWNGAGYDVVFVDGDHGETDIYLRQLDAEGRSVGDLRQLTDAPGVAALPHLIRTDEGYVLLWFDRRDGRWRLYVARLDQDFAPIGAPRPLIDGYLPSLPPSLVVAEAGGEYGLAWTEWVSDDGPPNLYFAHGRLGCP